MDYIAMPNDCMRYANAPIERALVAVESSANPFAIGVVGGRLERQPRNKAEAVQTALSLKAQGFNYSMGCRQVNQANLGKYGLDHESVFDPKKNALVGTAIYDECNQRAVVRFGNSIAATRAALSCYYSGNFNRGQQKEGSQPSYVDKVLANLTPEARKELPLAIPVIAKSGKAPKPKPAPQAEDLAGSMKEEAKPEAPKVATWDVFQEF